MKKAIYYVYVWFRTDKNEVFYVGKGKGNRSHDMGMRNRHFLNVVNKVGMDNIVILKLEENLEEQEAYEREKYYIAFYESLGHNLTNKTKGGEGSSDWYSRLTEEEKQRHREISAKAFTGKKHSEETKKKMSEKAKGRKHSPESIEKMKKTKKENNVVGYWKGKTLPEDFRRKISEAAKTRTYGRNSNARGVVLIDKNGSTIHFSTRKECAEFLNIAAGSVLKYIRSGKECNGYIIKEAKDYDSESQSTIESVDGEKDTIE